MAATDDAYQPDKTDACQRMWAAYRFVNYDIDEIARDFADQIGPPAYGWVVDTGVGGTFSSNVEDAKWWHSPDEVMNELTATEMVSDNYRGVRQNRYGFHAAGYYIVRIR